MRKKLLSLVIVAICISMQVFATDYYISNSGSDSNSGTSPSTPWTLTKFNSVAASLRGGDRCLFNRGEVFRGTVTISNSNSATAKFTYGAYGTGAKPVLSGAKLITGWANVNGTYEATASDLITHLFVNGKQATIARIPNKGYLWVGTTDGFSLTNAKLNVSPSLVGATWHYRKQNDWITKGTITSHSGGTIGGLDKLVATQGFYVDDCKAGLDSVWEWWQDDATKKVYLKLPSGMNPNSLTVEGSVFAKGFEAWAPSNLIFDNLDMRYYTEYAMRFNIGRFIDVTNCDFKGINNTCIRDEGQETDRGQNLFVNNCTFYDCNSTAVEVSKSKYFTFTNNLVKRIALIPGYEYNSLVAGMGLNTTGVDYGNFSDNIFDSIGYSCIVWSGSFNMIQHNIISRNGLSKNDNGYIQCWGDITNNSTIKENICYGGGGNIDGMDPNVHKRGASEGIYFDDFTRDNKVIGNTVIGGHNGIFIQASRNFEIYDNVTYDASWNGLFINEKDPYGNFSERQWGWSREVHNINVHDNVFFATKGSQMAVRTSTDACDEEMDFGTLNRNYVFNPYSKIQFIFSKQPCDGNRFDIMLSLKGWQDRYAQDMNSKTNNFIWSENEVQNIGANLTPNGTFDANISGYSAYQSNFSVSWASGVAGLTGGCLKITNRETQGDLSSPVFNVTQGKKYVVRFKIKASAYNNVNALMVENNPFNYMSANTYLGYDNNVTQHQVIYTATKTVAVKMSLRFAGQDDIWMDDFEVYEAGIITPVDYYAKSKLFFNDTKVNKTFDLAGKTYTDLDGNAVTGSITLAPFKSRILLLGNAPVPNPTSVSISPNPASVAVTATVNLTANVLPADASQSVTWTSSNNAIATVSTSGVVTGVAQGSVTITATTQTAGKIATCVVTVTPPVVPTAVALNYTSNTLTNGNTLQLTATVSPSNATNKNVTWSSSNNAVATVSNGLVTAVGAGSATITVTTVSGAKTATCAITVPAIPVISVSLNSTTATISIGGSAGLTAIFNPANATNKNVSWSSSNASVASVSSAGVVTGVAVGNATITVTTADGGKTATCSVTVNPAKLTGTVIGTAGSYNNNGNTRDKVFDSNTASYFDGPGADGNWAGLDLSQNYTITSIKYYPRGAAEYRMNGGKFQGSNTANFSSGVVDLATITTNPPLAWTTVTISNTTQFRYVRYLSPNGGYGNVAEVEFYGTTGGVSTVPVTSVSLNNTTASLNVGGTITLIATVAPSNATNKNVTWSSSNTSFATVSTTGVVTAVSAGNAIITVTTVDQGKTATCAVNVSNVNVPVTGVTLPSTIQVQTGQCKSLTATITPSNATNKNVIWSSNNTAIATVNTTGQVCGITVGNATITVTTVDGSKTATCAVTVTTVPVITGTVEAEFWTGITGTTIPAIPTTAATQTSTLTSLEIPVNAMDNYLVRIRGYIVPSTTGTYNLYIASDDNGQLWLSSNSDPANKAQIASVGDWANSREWTKYATQKSANTNLTVGNKYYFEAIAKEGAGGDNLAIGWTGPGITAITVIGAANIDKYVVTPPTPIVVTGVSVAPTTASINIGTTTTLAATVAPSNATNKTVSWSSSNTSIATVNSSGVVTGVAVGNATITVTTADQGKTATCAVTVNTAPANGKLNGTIIGTTGSYNNNGNTRDKAFDGNTGTFFDAPGANGNWVGLDLGATYQITSIKYYPRSSVEYRMNGGIFQASNTADFSSGVVAINTITVNPPLAWSTATVSNTTGYRYVRYLAPSGSYGNVAEIEFYGTLKSVEDTEVVETVDEITNILNNTNNQTFIYPNPVSNILHIAGAENATINIYSIEGKLVTNLKATSENVNIDVSGFNKGLYILSIQSANQNVVTRLVVK